MKPLLGTPQSSAEAFRKLPDSWTFPGMSEANRSVARERLRVVTGPFRQRDAGAAPGGGERLLRVINTRALILLDPATARYSLAVGSRWLESAAPAGAAGPPPAIYVSGVRVGICFTHSPG